MDAVAQDLGQFKTHFAQFVEKLATTCSLYRLSLIALEF